MTNLAELSGTKETFFHQPAKQLYRSLANDVPDHAQRSFAAVCLQAWLDEARGLPIELPQNIGDLDDWIVHRTKAVGDEYRQYLVERKEGAPRRFFSNRSHALYFIKAVAPTKLVDGAWLYGLLPRWQELDYLGLIRTYLEELGDGVADKNHVVLYKKLLETHGCTRWDKLSEPHFIQGAIQLALAYQAEHFLPEVIGYNLGYEQLPLHLLITSYELNELGIDPYYFTLHITIDNAATGHAYKALHSLRQLMPLIGDQQRFYQRVIDGYRLNDLGANTVSIIRSFNLNNEVVTMFQEKADVGKNMHSDYCRVAGRTVNDWLSSPDNIAGFLAALVETGWIIPGEPAQNSRFWQLIDGERSEMFGVFNEYEQQLLRDWIESGQKEICRATDVEQKRPQRAASFRARRRATALIAARTQPEAPLKIGGSRGVLRTQHQSAESNDFTAELRLFEQQIAELGTRDQAMQTLIRLMSPAHHHTRAGLMATRVFSRLLT